MVCSLAAGALLLSACQPGGPAKSQDPSAVSLPEVSDTFAEAPLSAGTSDASVVSENNSSSYSIADSGSVSENDQNLSSVSESEPGSDADQASEDNLIFDEEISSERPPEGTSEALRSFSQADLYRENEDGTPAAGWFTDGDGSVGYCGENGYLLTGFQVIDGFRYLFTEDGDRVEGAYTLEDGQVINFTEDGKQYLNSIAQIGHDWYFFDESGYIVKDQWITFPDGSRGFSDAEGRLYTGSHRFGDRVYTFTSMGRYRHDIDANTPMIALTYDDGPSTVNTQIILNTLRTYGAHATFFVLGRQVNSCAAIIQEIEDSACEIGNHTYNHYILTNMDGPVTNQEISATSSYVQMITGDRPMIMRPPTGGYDDQSCANVAAVDDGYPLILWSVDTIDWKHRDAATTCQRIRDLARDGSIVLMHDMEASSAEASAIIIPELIAAGYQLVTVSELAAARGITMEPGHVYNHFYPEETVPAE